VTLGKIRIGRVKVGDPPPPDKRSTPKIRKSGFQLELEKAMLRLDVGEYFTLHREGGLSELKHINSRVTVARKRYPEHKYAVRSVAPTEVRIYRTQ
jgi:hypothetical protein